MSALDALAEMAAWIEPIMGGWRYLLSPDFRARTHESWRHENTGYVIWEVFWGVLGITMSVGVACFAAVLIWRAAVA